MQSLQNLTSALGSSEHHFNALLSGLASIVPSSTCSTNRPGSSGSNSSLNTKHSRSIQSGKRLKIAQDEGDPELIALAQAVHERNKSCLKKALRLGSSTEESSNQENQNNG